MIFFLIFAFPITLFQCNKKAGWWKPSKSLMISHRRSFTITQPQHFDATWKSLFSTNTHIQGFVKREKIRKQQKTKTNTMEAKWPRGTITVVIYIVYKWSAGHIKKNLAFKVKPPTVTSPSAGVTVPDLAAVPFQIKGLAFDIILAHSEGHLF